MSENIGAVKFTVTAGMTPEDVRKSENASEEQKAVAFLFDTDGIEGYSKEEADAFNNATIQKHAKKYSVWTQNEKGQERQIKYKENKYIKINDYEGNWATSSVKQVWDKAKEKWRTAYDCTFKNSYIQRLYYTTNHGRTEVTENFREPMVIINDTKTKYDKEGNMIESRYREYNGKGKVSKEIVIKKQ